MTRLGVRSEDLMARDEALINAGLPPNRNIILGPGLCTFEHWGGIPWQSNRIGWS
jgi:hypothetical protein